MQVCSVVAGNTARFQIAENLHPELGAFGLLDPQAQDVARAVRQDRERQVNRVAADRRFVANLHPQRIEEHHGVQALERPALPGGHFSDEAVGHRADQIRRDLHAIHLREKTLDLAYRHPTGIEGQDLVVKPCEAPLVFRNEPRFERPVAIARHVQGERPVIGEHGLAACPVAVIRRVLGFCATWGGPQMVGPLAAERALNDRFLAATDRGIELLRRDRALANELIKNLGRNRCEGRVRGQRFPFAAPRLSSCYAPHTKLRIPSRNPDCRQPEPRTTNLEQRTQNNEPRTTNYERLCSKFFGNRIVNVEPRPSSVRTSTVPPWARTMARTRLRPRPRPRSARLWSPR
jgi:hypothetical protein